MRRATLFALLRDLLHHDFYPRSPCGERLYSLVAITPSNFSFLSTLSLRRATNTPIKAYNIIKDFYPRSPCGERQSSLYHDRNNKIFLSTLSLRRATPITLRHCTTYLFLSTLSLRRATHIKNTRTKRTNNFYPRSPCGERPRPMPAVTRVANFYPRSPCGERREPTAFRTPHHRFLSTLSLRRATTSDIVVPPKAEISIHALLAESDERANSLPHAPPQISIHALLAESDKLVWFGTIDISNFYPRSPCGERPKLRLLSRLVILFLSTLSLRRATFPRMLPMYLVLFLSTLSLRRATLRYSEQSAPPKISIHALLAESDWGCGPSPRSGRNFYPRSPCGERLIT